MNQFLADYYGTGASGNDDADALEKMAQLTLLVKEAEEENIDLSDLSDNEVMALAEELYGGEDAGEINGGEDLEKEAQAKFEEADFLGRVMAHSMWQELDTIQKEAGRVGDAWKAVKTLPGKLFGRARQVEREASERLGERLLRPGSKRLAKAEETAAAAAPGGGGKYIEQRKLQMALAKRRAGRQAAGAAAGGTALLTGGGIAAHQALKKKGSALDALIEQRAIEHLAAAGYVDQGGNVYGPEKTASDADFNTMVDKAALELLEQNGYPVQWR